MTEAGQGRPSAEGTSEQRPEEGEGGSQDHWEQRNRRCKGPGAGMCLVCWRNSARRGQVGGERETAGIHPLTGFFYIRGLYPLVSSDS